MNRSLMHVVSGFFVGLLIFGMAVAGFAEDKQQASQESANTEPSSGQETNAPAANGQEAESAATAPTPAPAASDQQALVSVDFKDADIRQVLRVISLKSGVDVVAGADVEGLVTIKLSNVPWEQALDIILRTYGYTYERKGNIVRVMTVEALEKEALATEVFPLDYAKAKEVPGVIQEMLSDRGKVKFDERTNTVIVTDIPTNLFRIKQVIARIDRRTPQVSVASKVVETKLEKNENLGIDWNNSLALTQTIPSVSSTFPFTPNAAFGSIGAALGTQRAPERPGSTIGLGTLSSGSLTATLNFLQSRTDTHIVSNPNIVILDNQEAKIHIGEEYPVPTYTIDPTTGRTSISGYTPKLTGTVLTVTPHVNPSNEVVVDLKPEIITVGSDVTYSLGTTSGSVSFPRFTTQTAKTQVRIRDGDTIAIGGLVKSSEGKVQEKVPLLGDIPLLGLLFKNTRWYSGSSDPNRQDLIIFLTVNLLDVDHSKKDTIAAAPAGASP